MYAGAADEFKKQGCELVVMASADDLGEFAPVFRQSGYEVIHFPYPKNLINRWLYYRKMIKYVRDHNIDVIHIHSSGMKWGMSLVARAAGIRSVYTFHSCFKSRTVTWPWHKWLRWSAKHVFGCKFQSISDSVCDNERSYWHNDTIKIYNWYNNNKFYPPIPGEKEKMRRQLGISADAIVFISVGGCSHIKRHSEIINIIPQLKAKYSKILYLHLGQGSDTDAEKQLAESLGVKNEIRFIGNTQDVRKYLIASDIYLMTSKFEGISITTIEAMACRIPAVVYDVPGLRDFNNEAECALIVQPEPKALLEGIDKVLSTPSLSAHLTENAYQLVTSRFFMPTNTKEIYRLYTQ